MRTSEFDLRSILSITFIYDSYQKIVGGYKARRLFIEEHVDISPGQKMLDIGCGSGYVLDFLPDIEYFGYDLSQKYIKTAKKKYGNRGNFICAEVSKFNILNPGTYDYVIASGVLHHLSNEECKLLFETALIALKSNGKLITLDGCFVPNQNIISKFFLKLDRGEFIRNENEYIKLSKKSFKNVKSSINNNYFNIPYTCIVQECTI